MPPFYPYFRFRGFTLIEFLVVIVIVGIVAGIIIPVLGKVRESTECVDCANNMRQIHSALMLYAADHNQYFPPISSQWPPGSVSDHKCAWQWAIWTYAGYEDDAYDLAVNGWFCGEVRGKFSASNNIFQCKSSMREFKPVPNASVRTSGTCYGLNTGPIQSHVPSGTTFDAQVTVPMPLAYVEVPPKTVMLLESAFYCATQWGYLSEWGLLPHNGATNIVFYDGHVENWPWEKFQERGLDDLGKKTTFWRGSGGS